MTGRDEGGGWCIFADHRSADFVRQRPPDKGDLESFGLYRNMTKFVTGPMVTITSSLTPALTIRTIRIVVVLVKMQP